MHIARRETHGVRIGLGRLRLGSHGAAREGSEKGRRKQPEELLVMHGVGGAQEE